MPHSLPTVIARAPRILPQLYGPSAQNDNDHPNSPAAAAALRPNPWCETTAAAVSADRALAQRTV